MDSVTFLFVCFDGDGRIVKSKLIFSCAVNLPWCDKEHVFVAQILYTFLASFCFLAECFTV